MKELRGPIGSSYEKDWLEFAGHQMVSTPIETLLEGSGRIRTFRRSWPFFPSFSIKGWLLGKFAAGTHQEEKSKLVV